MKSIGYFSLVIVLGVVALAVGYATNSLPDQIKQPIDQTLSQLSITTQIDSSQLANQATELQSRGSVVFEQGSKVLGAAITVDQSSSQSSLTDRALEYGRYLYCKQVVDEWETTHQDQE